MSKGRTISEDFFSIIHCSKCGSEIAIDEQTIYPIDCDCGKEISEKEAKSKDVREKVQFT